MGQSDRVYSGDRLGKRLVWLTIGSFVLWPLGTALGFFFGDGVGNFLSRALSLPPFLLLVITVAHISLFVPARQMWRRFRPRREGEDGASPADDSFSDLLIRLLGGLFWVPLCLFLGLAFTDDALGGLRIPRSFGRLLLIVGISGGVLCYLYAILRVLTLLERRSAGPQTDTAPEEPGDFTEVLVAILVAIARADGRFTRAELDVILNFFKAQTGYDAARLARVKRLVKHALDYPKDINRLLETLAASFPYNAHLIAVELVFRLVHTKNPPLAAELRLARDIAAALEIRPADLKNIEAQYRDRAGAEAESARQRQERERREREERLKRERTERQQREREERARREREEARRREERGRQEEERRRARFSSRDEQAFAILGLEPGARFAAIKKSYRKLVVQYHPDKVGHLGEEYRRIATEKTKELNAAYRHLAERFGQ